MFPVRSHLDVGLVVGNQLLVAADVYPHVAGVPDGRRRDADVDLPGTSLPQQRHELRERVAAHERVVHEDDRLARQDVRQRVVPASGS